MKNTLLRAFSALAIVSFGVAAESPTSITPPNSVPRTFALLTLPNPRAVAVDATGNLYVGDVDSAAVYKIAPAGEVAVVPGSGTIKDPIGIAVDRSGTLMVSDADANTVYKIPAGGSVTTIGKPAQGEPDLATPTSVAMDAAGNSFITDNGGASIRKIAPDGTITTLAGKAGATGNSDGAGAAARFASPRGIAIDRKGNLYVVDEANNNLRKITPGGNVSTLAGGFAGPRAVTADTSGNIFVADTDNHVIRKISSTGEISVLAGKLGEAGGANGIGAATRFSEPRSVTVDVAGNVFVADTGNGAIRQITPDGIVSTVVAGTKP